MDKNSNATPAQIVARLASAGLDRKARTRIVRKWTTKR